MRKNLFVPLVLCGFAACSNANHAENKSADAATATPAPLRACESREVTLDNVDMMLQANIDGTTAAITILHAPDADAQDKAVEEARKLFGAPHPDTRTMTHQSKWGIVEITDPCGRPVNAPSPAASPG